MKENNSSNIYIDYFNNNIYNVYVAERIAWKGKMAQGKNIYYWVDSANTHKTQITTAVKRLRYPDNIWTYSKIYLNYVYMSEETSDKKSGTILHELCHAYGGKDVYDNKNTIMYGVSDRSVTKLTKDFNDVLIEKYNY